MRYNWTGIHAMLLCWLIPHWSNLFSANWTGKPPHSKRRGRSIAKRSIKNHNPRPVTSPCSLRQREHHKNISSVSVAADTNVDCMLLRRLPAELRSAIWAYAIGGDEFCLITIPWKLTTAPHVDPAAAFDTWDDIALSRYHTTSGCAVQPLTPRRTALLKTCRQIYIEAVELLYSTNTFVLHDCDTLVTLSRSIPPQRLDSIRSLRL